MQLDIEVNRLVYFTTMAPSPPYDLRLPHYAQGANSRRLVKLFCKGRCCKTRWAEMNTDYPGEEILRKAQLCDFSATCLFCGRVAHDPYNWYLDFA
jgi:hypothetical protein